MPRGRFVVEERANIDLIKSIEPIAEIAMNLDGPFARQDVFYFSCAERQKDGFNALAIAVAAKQNRLVFYDANVFLVIEPIEELL